MLDSTASLEELEIFNKAIAPIGPTLAALVTQHNFVNSTNSESVTVPHNKKINIQRRLFCTKKKKKNTKSSVCKPSNEEVNKIAFNLTSKM